LRKRQIYRVKTGKNGKNNPQNAKMGDGKIDKAVDCGNSLFPFICSIIEPLSERCGDS